MARGSSARCSGYGFHEDGLKSAVAVVEAMGVEVPWRRGRVPAALEKA